MKVGSYLWQDTFCHLHLPTCQLRIICVLLPPADSEAAACLSPQKRTLEYRMRHG